MAPVRLSQPHRIVRTAMVLRAGAHCSVRSRRGGAPFLGLVRGRCDVGRAFFFGDNHGGTVPRFVIAIGSLSHRTDARTWLATSLWNCLTSGLKLIGRTSRTVVS